MNISENIKFFERIPVAERNESLKTNQQTNLQMNIENSAPQTVLVRRRRILAYTFDAGIFWAINILTIIPVIGIFFDLIAAFYMLLRDVTGASLGKQIFGLQIIDKASGQPASVLQRILRNAFFALPFLVEWIPGLGFFLGTGTLMAIGTIELLMLLASGERLGDKFAGTTVVRK